MHAKIKKFQLTIDKMKKLILFAAGILLFLSTFTASAAAKTPDEILPDTVNFYMKADPSNINETFANYYTDMIESFVINDMFYLYELNGEYSYWYGPDEPTSEFIETAETVGEIFSTEPLYMGLEADYDIDGYLEPNIISFMFEMSENDYENNILSPYIADNSTITELNGISIYEPEDVDAAIAYYEGYLLFADTPESIGNILTATKTLSENADFSDISNKFLSNNFFELYIGNIQIFLDEFYGYGMNNFYETMMSISALESVGFSMKESSTGYEFQSYVNQDPEVLAELDIDYSDMEPLSLQEFMPKAKPLFYTAKNNSADVISVIKNSYEYDTIATEIADELHIDLDEFVFALENETAFLIQDSGELFPTVTLLAKLKDNKDSLESQLSQLIENSWKSIQEEIDNEENSTVSMTKDTIQINGASLDQFTLKITPNVRKNPYALVLDPSLLEFKITIGITADDILLISTNKDIINDYKEGLQNNSDLEDLFSSTTDAVSFLDISRVNNYLQNSLTILEEYLPENFSDLTETKSVINTLLEPWSILKGTDSITNEYISSEVSILANINKIISNYNIEKLEEKFDSSSNEEGTELIFSSPKDFSDVEIEDWYGDNVYYLATKGIVDGHPDGTYKPSDRLNRAEFIKLITETLQKEGYLNIRYWYGEKVYDDVEYYEWYSNYVHTAYEERLFLFLWENDTHLYPSQDMTRIEAAQILSNVLNTYSISATTQNTDEMTFIDVSSNNQDVIEDVFNNNIMVGTSDITFSPTKSLNRAEAASIIRNLLEIL